MKQAVLLVGHGSRDPEGNKEFVDFARQAGMHYCMLDYVEPSLPTGIANCHQRGAKSVVVLPYFLFTSTLVKEIHRVARKLGCESRSHLGIHPVLLHQRRDEMALPKSQN